MQLLHRGVDSEGIRKMQQLPQVDLAIFALKDEPPERRVVLFEALAEQGKCLRTLSNTLTSITFATCHRVQMPASPASVAVELVVATAGATSC